jgi:hypothetical protein
MPAIAVSQCFTQVRYPEASLGLRTPCMAPVSNCTFGMNENKSYLYLNPLSTHSLRTLQLHSLQEFSGLNRETIETHSFSLSNFHSHMKIIYTTYTRKCITGANIHEDININTWRTTQSMNLNPSFLLIQMSVHGCSYTALCMLSSTMLLHHLSE